MLWRLCHSKQETKATGGNSPRHNVKIYLLCPIPFGIKSYIKLWSWENTESENVSDDSDHTENAHKPPIKVVSEIVTKQELWAT